MPLKILIAEDDRHTRRILEHIFTKDPAFRDQNVQMLAAPDGEEALKLFEKESPDLVISDLLMPRLDGFALCRAIRRLPNGKDVPVIVTSAIYKETALLNRMREELGVEFFAKPFQVRELVRGVQRLLAARAGPAGAPSAGRSTSPAPPPIPHSKSAPNVAESQSVAGELSDRSLATLLLDFLEDQSTGVLKLTRGRVQKEIFFILGNPVGAESNVRSETLGYYLLAREVITEQQYQAAIATATEQRLSPMETIVRLGLLSETDVFRHHTALVKLKIINALRWHDGSWQFVTGDNFSRRIPKSTIDVVNILFLGLKRVITPDEAARQLEPVSNQALLATPRAEYYQDRYVKVFGKTVMGVLAAKPTVSEMLAKGLEPLQVYTQVSALLDARMVKLGQKRAAAPPPLPPGTIEDPLDLKQLKSEATRQARQPTVSAAHGQAVYEELYGVDEISVVTEIPHTVLPAETVADVDLLVPDQDDDTTIEIELDVLEDGMAGGLSAAEAQKLVVSTYLGIHDKNHYELLGVSPDGSMPAIKAAHDVLAEQFRADQFVDCDLGLDHPKLEEINVLLEKAWDTLSDPMKRAAYDDHLEQQAGVSSDANRRLEAEQSFQRGLGLLGNSQAPQARAAFEEALRLQPESPDLHAYVAWARCQEKPGDPGVQQTAIAELKATLEIDRDHVQAHIFLGQLYTLRAEATLAVDYLERALDLEPGSREAFEALAKIHTKGGDWKLLERQHRKVLHRLGKRPKTTVVKLWKSLATVYEEQLSDPDSARTALEVAAQLAPEDSELADALAALNAPDPDAWREQADELRARLAQKPGDATILADCHRLFHLAGQHDASWLASATLNALGTAEPAQTAEYRRYQPRFLIRARRTLNAQRWAALQHPDDDPQTITLFETLARLETDFDFGGSPHADSVDLVADDEQPEAFGRALGYLSDLLEVPIPLVAARTSPDQPVALADPLRPKLLVDQGLLQADDTLAIAAQLAAPMAYLKRGRAFGIALAGPQLKALLMGAMKVVAPKLKVADPDGAIEATRLRLLQTSDAVRAELTKVITELTRARSSLNITRWIKGLALTADRFSLLVTGDPTLALAQLSEARQPSARPELIAFALSAEHLLLREQLALSIAV